MARRGWLARLAVVLAGAMGALGFAPLHWWGFTLISLALLYLRLRAVAEWDRRPARSAFATGLLFGLGWFSASCFWIASAFIQRGPEFIPLIPPLVGGGAIVLALFWAVAASVCARLMRGSPDWIAVLSFVSVFTLAEFARGHVASGFPWSLAAYAFAPGGVWSQSASLIGAYGLSVLVMAVAALLATRRVAGFALSALLAICAFGYGHMRIATATQDIQPGVIIRLVDVPFRQSEKIDPNTSFNIINQFIEESVQPGIADVTHLVWPEGAVNGLAIENEPLLRAMGRELMRAETRAGDDTPPVWLMNSLRSESAPDPRTGLARPRYYNSSVAITFDTLGNPAVVALNDKRKLVPFGEFIPGGRLVEDLGAKLVSTAIASISAPEAKSNARFPGLPPLSPQICYEVIFPGLTPRTKGPDDPQLILNQSNDAWFGRAVGPAQHAAIARYRAIEEGLPMIRSAANGISGVFDGLGREHAPALTALRVSHLDTTLPKPLKTYISVKVVNFAIVLISLCLLLLCALNRRFTPNGRGGRKRRSA